MVEPTVFHTIMKVSQVYDTIMPLILKNTFQLGDSIIGIVMAMDTILALAMIKFLVPSGDHPDYLPLYLFILLMMGRIMIELANALKIVRK